MARGLSELQKKILSIVNDMDGGYLTQINEEIKAGLYPEFWSKKYYGSGIRLNTRYYWMSNKGYGRDIQGNFVADVDGFLNQQSKLLKIRVTISNSIAGLVRRGLLVKTGNHGKRYRFTRINLTDAGKLLINDPRNVNN